MRRFFDYEFGGLSISQDVGLFEYVSAPSFSLFVLPNIYAAPEPNFPLFADIDGTSGDDTLDGTADGDTINGFAGNDTINGLAGDDTLTGGDGDDIVNGGAGDDTILLGGNGEDTIDGGDGFDHVIADFSNAGTLVSINTTTATPTFRVTVFNNGFLRHDITNVEVYEQRDTAGNLQVLGQLLTVGNDVFDLSTQGILGSAIVYGAEGNDTIMAGDAYDGTVGALVSGRYANQLYGGDGDDILTGGLYRDFIVGGAGADILNGGGGDADVLSYGLSTQGVTVNLGTGSVSGGHANGDVITNFEEVSGSGFDDVLIGDAADNVFNAFDGNDVLDGGAGDDRLFGGSGDDVINGGSGDDYISGGEGTDILTGGMGNDTFRASGLQTFFSSSITDIEQGDIIEFQSSQGGSPRFISDNAFNGFINEIRYYLSNGQTIIEIDGDGDALADSFITLTSGHFNLTANFPGSNILELSATPINDPSIFTGTSGDDTIDGTIANDTINGLSGNDTIDAFGGDDSVTGGSGNDSLDGGNGLDIAIFAGLQSDYRVIFRTLIERNIVDDVSGLDGFDGLKDFEIARFADGDVNIDHDLIAIRGDLFEESFIYGSASHDLLIGGMLDDVIKGDVGNDSIYGGSGNDILFGGDGDDNIAIDSGVNIIDGGNGIDYILQDESGLVPNFLGLSDGTIIYSTNGAVGSSSTDLLINIEGVYNRFVGFQNGGLINIFSDGSSGISAGNDNFSGTNQSDIINGLAGDDILFGEASNDWIFGGLGNDTLTGGAGSDVLYGGQGDDILVGGAGSNFIDGGLGSDTAVFSGPMSNYSISDDTAHGNRWYILDQTGSNANATLFNVQFAQFSDQTITLLPNETTLANIVGQAQGVIEGDDTDNIINGTVGRDILIGNGGNDTFTGGAGPDYIFGGDGDDYVVLDGQQADFTIEFLGEDIWRVRDQRDSDAIDYLRQVEYLSFSDGDIMLPLSGSEFTQSDDVINGTAASDILNALGGNDTVNGLNGNDTIFGRAGNDNLTGADGDDTLNGGDGADTLIGGDGADTLDGGDDFDTVDYRGATSAIRFDVNTGGTLGEALGDTFIDIERYYLSNFNDIITGSNANEFFYGEDGNDQINGGGGIDRIYGGEGNDIQRGQDGNDTLYGSAGADQLNGGAGFDIANYGDAAQAVIVNMLTGGTGGDAAGDSYFGIEAVYGSDFDDSLTGNNSVNELRGGDGDDALFGLGGNDRFFGGEGADSFDGGTGTDIVNYTVATASVTLDLVSGGTVGEANGDTFISIEWVFGSAFNDSITGDAANNRLEGRNGNDILNGEGGNDRLLGGDGNDTINGGDGVDTIFGQNGDDIMTGGAGNDFFFGGAGADSHDGGTGTDTVSYLASSSGVTVNMLSFGTASTGDAAGDSFTSIERIFGSGHDDNLLGNTDNNTLLGNGGNDYLAGGGGNDSLNGGAGIDSFGYDEVVDGADVITGFTLNETVFIFGGTVTDFASLQALGSDAGANVIFDFGGGNTLTIVGRNLADLGASNFDFSGTPPAGEPLSDPDAFAADVVDDFDMDALI